MTDKTEAPKKTRREKLAEKYNSAFARHAELAKQMQELAEEINSIDALAAVDTGTSVIVKIGRAETTQEVPGVVIGVREDEDGGKSYKVQYGIGFDADVTVVRGARIRLPSQEVPTDTAE